MSAIRELVKRSTHILQNLKGADLPTCHDYLKEAIAAAEEELSHEFAVEDGIEITITYPNWKYKHMADVNLGGKCIGHINMNLTSIAGVLTAGRYLLRRAADPKPKVSPWRTGDYHILCPLCYDMQPNATKCRNTACNVLFAEARELPA
jgi:hypothetical protein